ncbi:MAG: acetyl-CoA C-acetyltransferase [Deltaproteobacteria bacterium]|nr:acetyl-CoA C-acetyltransferase [Deltaproteobacteria bacterium]
MREVVIVSGVRTPIGNFGGSLKATPVVQLGALVIREALKRAGLRPETGPALTEVGPEALKGKGLIELEKKHGDWDQSLKPVQVDEVIMGNVLQGGQGQNTARQATISAGIPKETPAFTVNKICASGLKALTLGAQEIALEEADVVVAGGMENMSFAPYILPKARWGYRMDVSSKGELIDLMVYDGLWEIFYGYHMGNTAENIAKLYGISREEQDELGLMSHQRARKAITDGIFKEEIIPVQIPQRKGDPIIFDTDERPMDTSLEKMAKLPAVFKKDGTVTAGNASGINDAAAAVVLMTKEKAQELGLKPLVTIKAFASGAIDPAYMGLGPIPAVKKVLKATGLQIKDIDVVELNEAFASQAIACIRELGFDMERTNIHGSGISLGHPIGCTGARVTVTLINEMRRRGARYGLCTMCIGGGQGMAMVVEG